jgi:hypothetical protein
VVRVVQDSRFLTERLQVHAGESDVGSAEVASVGPQAPIGWIRQRIESIVNTLKDQLPPRTTRRTHPAGLLTGITARVLALCACINLNQRLGLTSRTLTPYTD